MSAFLDYSAFLLLDRDRYSIEEINYRRPHHNPHFMCRKSLIHKHCVNHVTWSVEQIATKKEAPYVLCRDGVYYFVRRIPVDMQHHYDKCRLYFSLRTQSKVRAVRAAQSITRRLDDYWMGVRLQKLDIPKLSVIPDWSDRVDNAPTLSELSLIHI